MKETKRLIFFVLAMVIWIALMFDAINDKAFKQMIGYAICAICMILIYSDFGKKWSTRKKTGV